MVTSIGSTPTRRRANGGTRRRVAIVTAVMAIQALLLAGCAQATPVTPVAPSTSATSVGTASAAPGLQATPAATSTPVTQFDGVWATRQLTIYQLRSAVQAHGMDPAHFNEVVGPNPGFSDHVVFRSPDPPRAMGRI
jgi:hypothetical protein